MSIIKYPEFKQLILDDDLLTVKTLARIGVRFEYNPHIVDLIRSKEMLCMLLTSHQSNANNLDFSQLLLGGVANIRKVCWFLEFLHDEVGFKIDLNKQDLNGATGLHYLPTIIEIIQKNDIVLFHADKELDRAAIIDLVFDHAMYPVNVSLVDIKGDTILHEFARYARSPSDLTRILSIPFNTLEGRGSTTAKNNEGKIPEQMTWVASVVQALRVHDCKE